MPKTALHGHPVEVTLRHETIFIDIPHRNIHLRSREYLGPKAWECVKTGRIHFMADVQNSLKGLPVHKFVGTEALDPGDGDFWQMVHKANEKRKHNMKGEWLEEERKARLQIYFEAKQVLEDLTKAVRDLDNAGDHELAEQYRIAEANATEAVGGINWQDFLDLVDAGEFSRPGRYNLFTKDSFMRAVKREINQ